MDSEAVTEALIALVADFDGFERNSGSLVERLKSEGANLNMVLAIIRFMELHPKLDYGAPGPLVHFAECFYGQGYEGALVDSVARSPTPQTVWMLNRLINGEKDHEKRAGLVLLLTKIAESPSVDAATRDCASDYLKFQARK